MRKYSDLVMRICVIQCQNEEDAKDCFQNVFLKLLQRDREFESEEHRKAWLIRVAVNECHSLYRSLWKKREVGVNIPENIEPWYQEERFGGCDIGVWEEVRQMDSKYSQVLYLYYYEEYETKEIAKLLHLSVNTVKSRLLRGRKKLKERIGEWDERTR